MTNYSLVNLLILVLVGIISGFINTLAGGGSFLTIPVLIFMGLPATVANATNRLGVFLQSCTAVKTFQGYGVFDLRFSLIAAIPATIGSVVGAYGATMVSDTAFKKYLAVFMIVMTLAGFLKPGQMLAKRQVTYTPARWAAIWAIFFMIGFYGGFIQAGVGFLILAGMLLTGFDFVAGNATKTFIILVFTFVSLVIFIIAGKVEYIPGLALGIGSMIGAAIGSRTTVLKGNAFVQKFVVVMVVIFSIMLLIR
ncbi:MAG: TSUP family transporter [Desulfobulbaceae bacterium]|nr:TSUP family transporter [Desulfobulbaceae bacterium]HIJ79809.1 TSUP family transporter [Deltaproteobacteria bacterium]